MRGRIAKYITMVSLFTAVLSGGSLYASTNIKNSYLINKLQQVIKQQKEIEHYNQLPKVSLNAINQPLGIVLQNFAVLTNYSLTFADGVNLNTPITIRLVNTPIKEAIREILDPIGYTYTIDTVHHRITVKAFVTKEIQIPPSIVDNEDLKYVFSSTGEAGENNSSGGGGGSGSSSSSTIGGTTEATGKIMLQDNMVGKDAFKALMFHIRSILSDRGTVSIDPITGSIFIRDYKPYVDQAVKVIKQWINSFSKELYVKAYVVDVSLNKDHEFGIDWNTIQRDIIRHSTSLNASSSSTNLISNPIFSMTVNNGSTINPFNLIIKALSKQGHVKVLSEPRIVIMNNEIGYIQSGDSIPYVSNIQENYIGTQGTNAQTTYEVDRVLEGITLAIKPHILNNGNIDLTIIPTLSSVKEWKKLTIGNNVIENPVITTRNMYTKLVVKDGQFFVIGGAQTNINQVTRVRIPILGDIPIIGGLFGTTQHIKQKNIMLVLLQVKVVTPKVAEKLHNEATFYTNGSM